MSDSEYILLYAVLEMGEGCSQKDIAENTFISKKTLNSTVKKLEQNEIIKLKPGKYPNMHIYLTPKGTQYVQEKMIPIMEAENAVLKNVTDEDFNSFALIATKYIDMFATQCSDEEE
jgi:DNA-binding MarR family transcriptional regulator